MHDFANVLAFAIVSGGLVGAIVIACVMASIDQRKSDKIYDAKLKDIEAAWEADVADPDGWAQADVKGGYLTEE